MAMVDVDNDGQRELLVGSDDFEVRNNFWVTILEHYLTALG